jgi:succinylglutamic semialdehyde dehydrogenase
MQFIDNWIEGEGDTFQSLNPATQTSIWEANMATPNQMDLAISIAKREFITWSTRSLEDRIVCMRRYQTVLESKQNDLALLISEEVGKPLWESKTEVNAAIAKIDVSIDAYLDRCPTRTVEVNGGLQQTTHRPHGVCLVLGPFNFPLHLPNGHIIPALLAGNTVVFKPSEHSPKVAELMIKCWVEAGLPSGVISLIQGDKLCGAFLAEHSGIDALFFTGSSGAGKHLLRSYSSNPSKMIALEMGGNNPLIVDQISDCIAAAYTVIQSAYITAGQRCTCARRLIIVEPHCHPDFLEILVNLITRIRVGAYTDQESPFMGPVIDDAIAKRLLIHQDYLINQGAVSLVQMTPIKGVSTLLTPGLIDVTNVTDRGDKETFGPFLQVIRVPDLDSAIQEANRTAYGLASGILTDNDQHFDQFYRDARAGLINRNVPTTGASSRQPFGGIGDSGNHRPSAYYAADYCAYPVASILQPKLKPYASALPGLPEPPE